MKKRLKHKARQRQGAALVEFAIVAPLLFLFFFAAFEFCRANMIRHTVDNAVYEAARVGIIPGATSSEAQQEADRILSTLGLTSFDVQVIPGDLSEDTEEVTVRVNVPLDANSFIPNTFLNGKSIERELTMVREGVRRGEN